MVLGRSSYIAAFALESRLQLEYRVRTVLVEEIETRIRIS